MNTLQRRISKSDASLDQSDDAGKKSSSPKRTGRKTFVIPGIDCDGGNPLRTLQRLKEKDKLASLPKSTPDLHADYRQEASNRGSCEQLAMPPEIRDRTSGSDTNADASVKDITGHIGSAPDINDNCVMAAASIPSSLDGTFSAQSSSVPQKASQKRRPPDVSPRHSSLYNFDMKVTTSGSDTDRSKSFSNTVETDGGGLVIKLPKPSGESKPFVTSPTKLSPVKRPKEPPPIPPIPKPKPKVIAKLVRDDPELRASQEKLTRTPDKQRKTCDMDADLSDISSLNSSLKDLRFPPRNAPQYSSFKDISVSPVASLDNSACSSLRDIAQKQTEKHISEEQDIYSKFISEISNNSATDESSEPSDLPRRIDDAETVNVDGELEPLVKDNRLSLSTEELDKAAKQLLELTGSPYLTPKSCLPALLQDTPDCKAQSLDDMYLEVDDIYSLPQPQCYGDSTLKAVKQITEKYDTLQRRKQRAMSFREHGRYSIPGEQHSSPCNSVHSTSPDEVFMCTGEKGTETLQFGNGVTSKDVARIDLFYRGNGTEVYVCRCLADITFTNLPPGNNDLTNVEWEPVRNTGVPVLMLNTGKGKRKRGLFVCLAERETGFTLWQDRVNYMSYYREHNQTVHAMQISTNLRRAVGLRFYSRELATGFMDHFKEITKDPNDDLWKIGGPAKTSKKRWPLRRSKSKKEKGPTKKDISQPCHFVHMTYVDPEDEKVQETVSDSSNAENTSHQNDYRRRRLSTT